MVAPTHGSVTVGDIPIDSLHKDSWWSQITWVPQRPAIVPGTIIENIGVKLSPELERAAHLTGFDDVVASLSEGWNTLLGQGGVGLSVGQRQRLALTRALIDQRPLVILDEPSAHLDAISEEYVSRAVTALKADGRTVLVIAHRTAILGLADHVIDVVSEDAAVEVGK